MASTNYNNFRAAIYTRSYEVIPMRDLNWLKERFDVMSRAMKVGKVYLESHRDMVVVDEATLVQARDFLRARGVQVSGGITVTVNERNRFQTYCYSNPEHRQKLKEVVELTARVFDEIVLDDFFFTNCKCPLCVEAKGGQSWTEFRLAQMTQAARELVLDPARAVNPKVEVVIKYPNWYEHFQGLGFNLEEEPRIFDGIYTGNETRDPVMSNQHLQQYGSYLVFRYFENIKPGGNRGGWVDPFGSRYLDRYAEQLWLTLFSKAPEITLFDFRSIQAPIQEEQRAPWQGHGASFDFDAVTAPLRRPDGSLPPDATIAFAAGAAFALADRVLGLLGAPLGVKAYKPYHSRGEDFLHHYLGMVGIPIELAPEFPADAATVLLTEAAKFDPGIVAKIRRQLLDGKNVVITSGLLRALQELTPSSALGLKEIVELEYTGRKQMTRDFLIGWNQVYSASRPVLVPRIEYLTNDSWEEISCMGGEAGTPLLHSAQYGRGKLFVLAIPDNFADLYALPAEVLSRIKAFVAKDLFVQLDAPAKVALLAYDNDTFIVESFLDEPTGARVVLDERFTRVRDLLSGEEFSGQEVLDWQGQKTGRLSYAIPINPHSFRAFQAA